MTVLALEMKHIEIGINCDRKTLEAFQRDRVVNGWNVFSEEMYVDS